MIVNERGCVVQSQPFSSREAAQSACDKLLGLLRQRTSTPKGIYNKGFERWASQ